MADPTLKDLMKRLEQLEALITTRPPLPPNPVIDPAPDPWGPFGGVFNSQVLSSLARGLRPIPDPPPFDFSRLNAAQLAVTKEMIKTERFRLDALEKLVDGQIKANK